jgi:hypothetical protein
MVRRNRDESRRDPQHENRHDRERDRADALLPESGMGGASDFGAAGGHPASHPEQRLEGRSPLPDDVPGDAAYERRRHQDPNYSGPERRLAKL